MVADDVFDVSGGNSGLTEEFIYNNAPSTPGDRIEVLTSATQQVNSMGHVSKRAVLPSGLPLKTFEGECVVVTRNGVYAGTMSHSNGKRFTANDHVYVLTTKRAWKDRVYLEWFIQQYQRIFWNIVSSKSDNATFNKEYLQRIPLVIPSVKNQRETLRRITKLKNLRAAIGVIIQNADLSYRALSGHDGTERLSMDTLFDVFGGNSGLTESFIYHHLPVSDDDVLEIMTGATQAERSMGFVSKAEALKSRPDLQVFDQESILLTRKGYAGTMTHVSPKPFTTNDDVYVIQPKPLWKDKVNLRWFISQYQAAVRNTVTSKSDNATFNKRWLQRLEVELPDRTTQDILAKKTTAIQTLSSQLERIGSEIESLLVQPVSS